VNASPARRAKSGGPLEKHRQSDFGLDRPRRHAWAAILVASKERWMRGIGRQLVLAAGLLTAACVPKPKVEAPPPRVETPPQPAPTPPAPAPAKDWADLPLTPGDWRYASDPAGARAEFATGQFAIRCVRSSRQVQLVRQAAGASGAIVVRTSYGARTLSAGAQPAGGVAATLAASDPLLDQIAFSRGRVTIEAAGTPQLVLPAWPEPARVIEECRL
jgi:hypothetical protein